MRPPTIMPLALLLAGAIFVSSGHASTSATSDVGKPSRTQLQRLYQLEPYIRYFTSLAYGPSNTRISADYIRALILTESGGDRWAQSVKGARGLTQIIPSTAQLVLDDLADADYDYLYVDEQRFEEFEPDSLYDPALNILIACYLSATYHDQFEGRRDLVVSAWNAGPGAVRRYGNEPPPYPETRTLINRIAAYMDFLETLDVN